MSVELQTTDIKSQLKKYFNHRGFVTNDLHNILIRLKDRSKLVFGLYHYHGIDKVDSLRFRFGREIIKLLRFFEYWVTPHRKQLRYTTPGR